MEDTEYEAAWHEDEEGGQPLEDAVRAAHKKAVKDAESEYAEAHAELDGKKPAESEGQGEAA